MLNNAQIKLVQTAVRSAGLRNGKADGRYRLLLGQYKQPNSKPVTSCKQLNNMQLDDLLAICESLGWCYPGKADNYFRFKVATNTHVASFAQQSAINHLAGDLGWNAEQLGGMLKRMTGGFVSNVAALSPAQAYKVIEALKAIIGREEGKQYSNLQQIKEDQEAKDGETNQI
ncbi:MAG: hypothetical protein AMJ75_09340 [Phycisphaerae bacterium SM1_79]|nr:MAG: hypothetical protein AMJ75_09340 [Phycisphaerae bacterium SM1_79]